MEVRALRSIAPAPSPAANASLVTAQLHGCTRALGGGAALRDKVFSPSPLGWGEEDEGKRKVRFFKEPMRPAAGADAGSNQRRMQHAYSYLSSM